MDFACTYLPTKVFTSVPPGMVLGQLVYFKETSVDKSDTTVLPPDIGEPGCWARLVYNDSGTDLAIGSVCARKAATSTMAVKKAPTSSDRVAIAGVSLGVIVTGSYGFMAVPGMGSQCKVLAGAAGFSADTGIKQSTVAAGVAVDSAASPPADAFAFAHEAATSGNLGRCTLL